MSEIKRYDITVEQDSSVLSVSETGIVCLYSEVESRIKELEDLLNEKEEKTIDEFSNKLLSHLHELGFNTDSCDGDEDPAWIIARWLHSQFENLKAELENSEAAHDITLTSLQQKQEEVERLKDKLRKTNLLCNELETAQCKLSSYKELMGRMAYMLDLCKKPVSEVLGPKLTGIDELLTDYKNLEG